MVHKRTERWQRYLLLAVTILCVGAIGAVAFRASRTPAPQLLRLADGTQIYYLSDTRIEPAASYPNPREVQIDGEAFIRATADAQPLVIRTRLLVLKITGSSALRVTARSSEPGQEADVLYGRVEATKAYRSPQSEPDILLAGQEVMVNETIDLQEKETADVPGLQAWSNALMNSVMGKTAR
jgi:ferric-dicitrate binding protein FerR (iron transport regulator)